MTVTTRWWWIRHAPVDAGGRIYGQCDLPADCSDDARMRWLASHDTGGRESWGVAQVNLGPTTLR